MYKWPSAEVNRKFQKHFGTSVRTYFNPLLGFDITKFDADMQSKFGYVEDGETSLNDFLTEKFGKEISNLVRSLI